MGHAEEGPLPWLDCWAAQARVLDEAEEALLAASGPPHRPANGCQRPRGLPPVRLRGLALAAVDLAARRRRSQLHSAQCEGMPRLGLVESIATYFASFGDSASCSIDLRQATLLVWTRALCKYVQRSSASHDRKLPDSTCFAVWQEPRLCNNDACTPGREYVAEVAGTARGWLAQQLHAACNECEADAEYPADRALRRRVSAFQAMPCPLSCYCSAAQLPCIASGMSFFTPVTVDERFKLPEGRKPRLTGDALLHSRIHVHIIACAERVGMLVSGGGGSGHARACQCGGRRGTRRRARRAARQGRRCRRGGRAGCQGTRRGRRVPGHGGARAAGRLAPGRLPALAAPPAAGAGGFRVGLQRSRPCLHVSVAKCRRGCIWSTLDSSGSTDVHRCISCMRMLLRCGFNSISIVHCWLSMRQAPVADACQRVTGAGGAGGRSGGTHSQRANAPGGCSAVRLAGRA